MRKRKREKKDGVHMWFISHSQRENEGREKRRSIIYK